MVARERAVFMDLPGVSEPGALPRGEVPLRWRDRPRAKGCGSDGDDVGSLKELAH